MNGNWIVNDTFYELPNLILNMDEKTIMVDKSSFPHTCVYIGTFCINDQKNNIYDITIHYNMIKYGNKPEDLIDKNIIINTKVEYLEGLFEFKEYVLRKKLIFSECPIPDCETDKKYCEFFLEDNEFKTEIKENLKKKCDELGIAFIEINK